MDSNLFDPDRVDKISIPQGNIYPWQHNMMVCLCQKCRREGIGKGEAHRFLKSRILSQPGMGNGYLCRACVTGELLARDWHWNPIEATLYEKQPYTIRPVSGVDLAAAFERDGERGIFGLLMERKK